jgi:hypothetical protein
MNLKTLAAIAEADMAKVAQFSTLGKELAIMLEALMPAEAPVIAGVVASLEALPSLVADVEKVVSAFSGAAIATPAAVQAAVAPVAATEAGGSSVSPLHA